MRTTVDIDDKLLAEARRLTGITKRSVLVHEGLRALIALERSRRLERLGGSLPFAMPISRGDSDSLAGRNRW